MNVIQFPGSQRSPLPIPAVKEEVKEIDVNMELERLHAELIRLEASVDQLHVTCRNLFLSKKAQK